MIIQRLRPNRVSLAWAILLMLTLISWESADSASPARLEGLMVIGIAMFKVRIIGLQFMDIGLTPRRLRLGFEIGIVVVSAILMSVYALSPMAPR